MNVLKALSYLYKLITTMRNFLYDTGIKKTKKVDGITVICIGNITVGGTGKTPCVQYYAKKYIKNGTRVAIVSRGYKGKRDKDPYIVCDGKEIFGTEKESGDEPFLHAKELYIPVIVSKNRYIGVQMAKEQFNAEIVLLDDGFQHRKLFRDQNILLIDATDPFGMKQLGKKGFYLLPYGRLRESIKGIYRANSVIITKSDMVEKSKIEEIKIVLNEFNKKISLALYRPKYLYNQSKEMKSLEYINQKKVLVISGLANPESFFKTVERFAPKEIREMIYPDHYDFNQNDAVEIERVLKENMFDIAVTTEKDYIKLKKFNINSLFVLKAEFEIVEDN